MKRSARRCEFRQPSFHFAVPRGVVDAQSRHVGLPRHTLHEVWLRRLAYITEVIKDLGVAFHWGFEAPPFVTRACGVSSAFLWKIGKRGF